MDALLFRSTAPATQLIAWYDRIDGNESDHRHIDMEVYHSGSKEAACIQRCNKTHFSLVGYTQKHGNCGHIHDDMDDNKIWKQPRSPVECQTNQQGKWEEHHPPPKDKAYIEQ
jgi:hypothetical protein